MIAFGQAVGPQHDWRRVWLVAVDLNVEIAGNRDRHVVGQIVGLSLALIATVDDQGRPLRCGRRLNEAGRDRIDPHQVAEQAVFHGDRFIRDVERVVGIAAAKAGNQHASTKTKNVIRATGDDDIGFARRLNDQPVAVSPRAGTVHRQAVTAIQAVEPQVGCGAAAG